MAKIKICGLRRAEDIKYVNELKPDFAGFIISNGFKRTVENPNELIAMLNKSIKSVGVFVDDELEGISKYDVDIVQLHGSESPEYCSKISKPVIKMLKPKDFDKVKDYEPFVDYFLFDSGTGTGLTFDWSAIPKTSKPFILAGGLGAENLENAINEIKPFAVDMSSSVETNGAKDYDKIKEVINIVRRSYE